MPKRAQVSLGILVSLLLLNYLVWQATTQAANPVLRVAFLDVGQGDAILIQTPTGEDILVDGGPDDSVLSALGKILPLWDRDLDLVVATHLEADHITGLVSVIERYQVKEILTPPLSSTTQIAKEWQNILASVPSINYVDSTDDYEWGEVTWDTLWPLPGMEASSDKNERSVVAKLTYHDINILLTGDIGADTEQVLTRLYPGLNADVLKVAHHGSKYSSSDVFLQFLQPQVAVISVGNNSYGHPAPDTLERLTNVSVQIYRTDQDGTIELTSTGKSYQVNKGGQKKFY